MTNRDLLPLAKRIAESAECDYITVLRELEDWFYRREDMSEQFDKTEVIKEFLTAKRTPEVQDLLKEFRIFLATTDQGKMPKNMNGRGLVIQRRGAMRQCRRSRESAQPTSMINQGPRDLTGISSLELGSDGTTHQENHSP